MTTIRCPQVLEDGRLVGPRTLTIDGDRITAVSDGRRRATSTSGPAC